MLDLYALQEAVTEFASRAALKLRLQNGHAGQVLTFIRTSPFRTQDLQYSRTTVVPLRRASNDSRDICQAALRGLQAIFRPGYRYAKAGVMLLDLRPADLVQQELALEDDLPDPGGTLMQLRFASFAVIKLRRDLHPQECAHAGRTKKSPTENSWAFYVWWSWRDLNPRPQTFFEQFYMCSRLIWISLFTSRSGTLCKSPATYFLDLP